MTKTILSKDIPAENLILIAYNPMKEHLINYDHVELEVMYYDPKRSDYFFARDQWKFPGLEPMRGGQGTKISPRSRLTLRLPTSERKKPRQSGIPACFGVCAAVFIENKNRCLSLPSAYVSYYSAGSSPTKPQDFFLF